MNCVLGVIFMLTLCLMLLGAVFVGLVTFVLAMVEMEITFTENADWEMCWILFLNGTC